MLLFNRFVQTVFRVTGGIIVARPVSEGAGTAITLANTPDPSAEGVSAEDYRRYMEFLEPYMELLRIFDPEATRDPEWIGDNLNFIHSVSGRYPSPFEILAGQGIEVIARYGDVIDNGAFEGEADHTIILSVPQEADMLARVTTVLAKYGIVPESFLSVRGNDNRMNMVLEINGSTEEAAEKFTAVLRQRLGVDVSPEHIRLFSRPAQRRRDQAQEYRAES